VQKTSHAFLVRPLTKTSFQIAFLRSYKKLNWVVDDNMMRITYGIKLHVLEKQRV